MSSSSNLLTVLTAINVALAAGTCCYLVSTSSSSSKCKAKRKQPTACVTCPPATAAGSKERHSKYSIRIEYCTGCRWLLRSAWFAQEILTTFAAEEAVASVSLCPIRNEGGVFNVIATKKEENEQDVLLWSRKKEGRFPEAKEVKQLIRNLVSPTMSLGHSDK